MNYLKETIAICLPEIVLFLFGYITFLISFAGKKRKYTVAKSFCFSGLILAICALLFTPSGTLGILSNSFVVSDFTTLIKALILVGALLTVLISENFLKKHKKDSYNIISDFLLLITSALALVSSNNFGLLFVAAAAISIFSAKLISHAPEGIDLVKRYRIVSGTSLLFILGGITYIFWFYRVFNFEQIAQYLVQFYPTVGFNIALVFIAIGLLFNILTAPFCILFPDIVEKTNSLFSVLCTTIIPIAGFASVIRLLSIFGSFSRITTFAIMILAVITLLSGTAGMICQKKMTRFLGYSTITHTGFMLIGICALYLTNTAAILFYLLCFVFMNIGVWSAVCIFKQSNETDNIKGYKGLFFKRPFYVGAFSICLFALAGMPPTSGFLSKLYIFMAMARSGLVYLLFLIFTMLVTVAAAYAYLRIIRLFFEDNEHLNKLHNRYAVFKYVLYLSTVITVFLCFFARPVIELCKITAYTI